jgi:NAD(P)-dependent dehydrogenase (short-subunit alcohol dehydrogenase family)
MVTLAGKNVVVVGASRGVGRAVVRRMAAEGAQVLAVGREPESLDQLAREVSGTKTLAMDAAGHAASSAMLAAWAFLPRNSSKE